MKRDDELRRKCDDERRDNANLDVKIKKGEKSKADLFVILISTSILMTFWLVSLRMVN